jgi:hypothetical protein
MIAVLFKAASTVADATAAFVYQGFGHGIVMGLQLANYHACID